MRAIKNAFVLFAQFDVCVGYTLLPGRGRDNLCQSGVYSGDFVRREPRSRTDAHH